jgi:putative ABC transport system permease protein
MKGIFRNFFFVLKRFKTSSILNILGLSVAFAVFSVTMIQVHFDFSYDKCFKKSTDIYFFNQVFPNGNSITMTTPLAKEMSEVFPEIKNYCLIRFISNETFDVINKNGSKQKLTATINNATVGLLDVFTPEILAGDPRQALTQKGKALISENTARRFFGNANPIGKTVFFHFDRTPLTVVAVFRDFPKNSSLSNDIFVYLPDDDIHNSNYKGYFEVLPGDINKLTTKINGKKKYGELTSQRFNNPKPEYKVKAVFQKLTDVHFDFLKADGTGSITTTLSLLAIGILTLIIAYINFLNFSITMAPIRVRGMNIQKILGANPLKLRCVVVAEGSLFSLLAFIISILIISFLKQSSIYEYFSADLSIQKNWIILTFIGSSSFLFGIIFGIYPARYITSFQPAVALSGSFSLSGKSAGLRNVLITLQFISAIILIIVSAFIIIQHNYMKNYEWGMQKENIVYLPSKQLKTNIKTFGEELKTDPRVLDYTASNFIPGEVGMSWGREFEGKQVSAKIWPVQPNFLRFFGVKIIEGRDFLNSDSTGTKHGIIFNQQFLKDFSFTQIVGKDFEGFGDNFSIVGIAKNVNYSSLKDSIQPMAFAIMGDDQMQWFILKISGKDTPATIKSIKKTWEKYCDEEFNIKFLNKSLDDLYNNESNLAKLISVFGLVIIVIAIMGVYGLIVFNARYKSKEIALRKVNGASVTEIMLMLNRNVLIQLVIAYVVAVPLAYYIVHRWLEQFAYKVPVYWWVFVLAGLLVFAITVITVSWQSYKAASANPVEAIKNE